MQLRNRRKNDDLIKEMCSAHYLQPDVLVGNSIRLYNEALLYIQRGYKIKAVKESITTLSLKDLDV